LRVLIVAGIFPPDIGGPATYVPEIAKALVERGHRVTVVTLSDRCGVDDRGYAFRVVRLSRRGWKPLRWARTVTEIAWRGRDTDVLFANGLGLETALAARLIGKPLVTKIVGDVAWEKATRSGWSTVGFEAFQSQRLSRRVELVKALRRWWVRQGDRVITPSAYLATVVRGWGVPASKVEVIPNAVEPNGADVPSKRADDESGRAVTVGRLVQWKHVDEVIRVLPDLPGLELLIIGDGPERAKLEAVAVELRLEPRVTFAGPLSRREAARHMALCDLFVLNSSYEGLPHVVLEAMALGLPVVATAVGGTGEIIRHRQNGLLIGTERSELRQAIAEVLSDRELRRRLGDGGRKTVAEFTKAAMIERTEAALISVVEARSA
jgi:glycosyltransferase involved in cell wall biosynthesis